MIFNRSDLLRSKELMALSKPLAILLVQLFSLTIHINTALAVGGENAICDATRIMNNAGENTPPHQAQIEHCGICIVSIQYKSFGLQNLAITIDTKVESKPTCVVSEIRCVLDILRYSQIRAPPIS
ncbi:MAG: hypothetical protein GY761_21495 [Hyphomicrobiales bacterium]|nr:hypothetical protein [Hyphomicrobiales bacterium]